ncbi:hypothetical protein, partial [Oceanicaulis alexandrii]|uniref:hypothetical protein n=1 Tax=Oceanicaulis alexandrii TaxID=153233 RepID=UPI002352EAEC
ELDKMHFCNTVIATARHPEKFTFKANEAAPSLPHPLEHECELVLGLSPTGLASELRGDVNVL